ncbi:hypothetical protein SESBI_32938 [Sesbania bispinosa]|nr:hypothetical protein SESBI_32938 [Sesbania bispinosa]
MLGLDPEKFCGALESVLLQKQKSPKAVDEIPPDLLTWLKVASLPLQPPVELFSSMTQMSSVDP